VEQIRLLVVALQPRDRAAVLALGRCRGPEPREQRLFLDRCMLGRGLGKVPLRIEDRFCRWDVERGARVLSHRLLQQFKEQLDPTVAVREQLHGFVAPVVGGATADTQRGAYVEYYHAMVHDDSNQPPALTPPLKRHATLQPLSREHMGGLIQARRLRQAADLDRASRVRAIAGFLDAWRSEIGAHFEDEERMLLPLVRSPALRDRLLHEHSDLRRLAERCEREPEAAASDAELVRELGVKLHDHIRWEEREFFEAVQRDHPQALAALASEAAFIETHRPGSRARHNLSLDEAIRGGEVRNNHDR